MICYKAAISACEKARQWQKAQALLRELLKKELESQVISYSAAIIACEKDEQWRRVLALMSEEA